MQLKMQLVNGCSLLINGLELIISLPPYRLRIIIYDSHSYSIAILS